MGRNPFTDEQILLLRQNPYTFSVTRLRLSFTKEFKEIFYSEYETGLLPRQILQDHGYDPAVLGGRRIWGISCHIRQEYRRYGGFRQGTIQTKMPGPSLPAPGRPASDKEELGQLRHEVDYLRQEIEFLKKISLARITRK